MPTILITGANRGLGLEFVRQYAMAGWTVMAACRQPDRAATLRELAEKHRNISIVTLDLTNLANIPPLAKSLRHTPLDVLLLNAGIFSGSDDTYQPERNDHTIQSFGTLDAKAWAKVLDINTIAPIMTAQAFLPQVRQGAQKKILALSSAMGSIGTMSAPGDIAYRTSKAALNAALRNMALTLHPEDITVASLHPGWVQTDMGGPEAPLLPPESVAGMRKVIDGLTLAQSGQFLDYNGAIIPW